MSENESEYTFTGADVIAKIREIVAADPEREYRRPVGRMGPDFPSVCTYVHADENGPEPGCLIGQALYALGVPLSKLCFYDTCYTVPGFYASPTEAAFRHVRRSETVRPVLESLGIQVSEVQMNWIVQVQDEQDYGISWGRAVELADEKYPSLAA